MAQADRFDAAAEECLPAELQELGELIAGLDSDQHQQIQNAFHRVSEAVSRRRRILGLVQEALSQLRLDVKYLMFDLEVTRRERDELQERSEGEESGF